MSNTGDVNLLGGPLSEVVGSTYSLAERLTKNKKGTIHREIVK